MLSKRTIVSTFHLFRPSMLPIIYDKRTDLDGVEIKPDCIRAVNYKTGLQTTIHYKNDEITDMTCDCGNEGYCNHILELVGYLYRNYDEVASGNATSPTTGKARLFQTKLEPGPQEEFRKVMDISSLLVPEEDLDLVSGPGNLSFEAYSEKEGLLNIDIEKTISWNSQQTTIVQFKWANDELFMRCSRCTDTSERLCEHQQQVLLSGEVDVLHSFIEGNFSIDEQYRILEEEFDIPASILQDHYTIYFLEEGRTQLRSNGNTHIILPSNAENMLSDHGNFRHNEDEKADILFDLYDENEEKYGNAIVWATNIHDQIVIKYVDGKLSKSKKKLTSHITEVEKPADIPHKVQTNMLRYDGLDTNSPRAVTQLFLQQHLEFLQQNAQEWNTQINYILTERCSTSYTIKKSDLVPFEFTDDRIQLRFHVSEANRVIHIKIEVEPFFQLPLDERRNIHRHPLFFVFRQQAFIFKHVSILQFMRRHGFEKNYIIPVKDKQLAGDFISHLVNSYHINIDRLDEQLYSIVPVSRRIVRISRHDERIHIEPVVTCPDGQEFSILAFPSQAAKPGSTYIVIPDQEAVDEFLNWCNELHPDIDTLTDMLGFYSMSIQSFSKDLWFLDLKEKCETAGIELEGWGALEGFSFNLNKAEITQEVDVDGDWFDIHFTIRYGDITVPQKDWIRAIRKGEEYILLKDGTYGVIPETWRLQMIRLLNAASVKKGKIQLSKLQFNAVDQYVNLEAAPNIRKDIEKIRERLLHFQGVKSFDVPSTVKASLRSYQKEGYHWLKFLNEYRFGGCLADDMGLGKTLQVISLLADQKSEDSRTSLVVVPRSLMHNWAAEIEKFCPTLTFLVHHGSQRSHDSEVFSGYDLIISTYGTVSQDVGFLNAFDFHYVILDESQAIKNPASKRYKAMLQLKSTHKLTMTGTPVENSTMDLYAQFNFINPGLLGNKTQFRKQFSDPIDKDGDATAKTLLHKIIHPFLLRRTKDQVARDLPARTESILYCEMEGEQKELYEKMKNEIRSSLLDHENLEQNKIMVLDGLLKLRQICNSPALLKDGDQSNNKGSQQSVKIDTLMEQIQEVVLQENHSVLVFSQFTTMLALVREQLDQLNIDYAYLDGSTSNRQSVIESFNADDGHQIFLISLKAGNTGLNLTKADFVYLLDPWWNPAVESQAIDRTHRIGQTKPVFAYRFICKDTIEEKIIKLQSKKTQIADDLIKTDENVFKSLNKEALIDLFE